MSRLQTINIEWFSIQSKLPDKNDKCLITDGSTIMSNVYYDPDQNNWYYVTDKRHYIFDSKSVTEWAYYPF